MRLLKIEDVILIAKERLYGGLQGSLKNAGRTEMNYFGQQYQGWKLGNVSVLSGLFIHRMCWKRLRRELQGPDLWDQTQVTTCATFAVLSAIKQLFIRACRVHNPEIFALVLVHTFFTCKNIYPFCISTINNQTTSMAAEHQTWVFDPLAFNQNTIDMINARNVSPITRQ